MNGEIVVSIQRGEACVVNAIGNENDTSHILALIAVGNASEGAVDV